MRVDSVNGAYHCVAAVAIAARCAAGSGERDFEYWIDYDSYYGGRSANYRTYDYEYESAASTAPAARAGRGGGRTILPAQRQSERSTPPPRYVHWRFRSDELLRRRNRVLRTYRTRLHRRRIGMSQSDYLYQLLDIRERNERRQQMQQRRRHYAGGGGSASTLPPGVLTRPPLILESNDGGGKVGGASRPPPPPASLHARRLESRDHHVHCCVWALSGACDDPTAVRFMCPLCPIACSTLHCTVLTMHEYTPRLNLTHCGRPRGRW